MKSLKTLLVLFLASAIGLGFVCCGPDNPVPASIQEGTDTTTKPIGGNDKTPLDANLLIGYWKSNKSNGYYLYEFTENGNYQYINYVNNEKQAITGSYVFDTTAMKVTLTPSLGTPTTLIIGDLTKDNVTIDGIVYVRVDAIPEEDKPEESSSEEPDNNRGPVAQSFRGNGTQNDPYIISDATELRKLSDDCAKGMTYRGEYFKMTADVTINRNVLRSDGELNGDGSKLEQWIPIGVDENHPFCGTFDGNGHTISGLYQEKGVLYIGLFGYFAGTVKNLTMNDSYFYGYCCGGIVGRGEYFSNGSSRYNPTIIGCSNYASVICSHWSAGGIMGYCDIGGMVDKCVNYGLIKANTLWCGGIVGGNSGSTFKLYSCVNYGKIVGNGNYTGGITGAISATVSNVANFGKVESINSGCYGIASGTQCKMNNIVNYGTIVDGYGLSIGGSQAYIKNGYYLETSCKDDTKNVGYSSSYKSMTSKEMQQQSFLDELNNNAKALGSDFSQWKFGKDGYPTLDFVKE